MSYSLEKFASECRAALDEGSDAASLEIVRSCVSRACADKAFVQTHLGEDNSSPRKLLYEDDKHGFCIFAHVYTGAAEDSTPHDHGPGWAVYGQAVGTTRMTDWREEEGGTGTVEAARVYDLSPGDAYTYAIGDIHSPAREGPTRLIRVEALNMDNVERRWFKPA